MQRAFNSAHKDGEESYLIETYKKLLGNPTLSDFRIFDNNHAKVDAIAKAASTHPKLAPLVAQFFSAYIGMAMYDDYYKTRQVIEALGAIGTQYPELAHKMLDSMDIAMSSYTSYQRRIVDALVSFAGAGDADLTEKVVALLEKHSASNNLGVNGPATDALIKLGRRAPPPPPPKKTSGWPFNFGG